MCFRHRADAGYFCSQYVSLIGQYMQIIYVADAGHSGYVLPIPLKFASAVRCSTIN